MILHNIQPAGNTVFPLQPRVCVLRERRARLTAICEASSTPSEFYLHITTGSLAGHFMTGTAARDKKNE